jgi:hypothetical protein
MTPPPALALADLDRIKEEISDDFDEELIEYGDVPKQSVVLPDRVRNADYIRHPVPPEMYVPSRF